MKNVFLLSGFMNGYYKDIKLNNVSNLRNKTILITGASGLVGCNLMAYLDFLNSMFCLNLRIFAVVRSLQEKWMSKSEITKYLKIDLTKKQLPKNIKADYIIHAATYGQPKKFLEFPEETVLLNTRVLFNLLEMAKTDQASFLYLSSAEIYGQADKENFPTKESYYGSVNTLSERAIYAESKRIAESICYLYRETVNIKIARLLIAYGPGVKYNDQRVISEFIKRAQETGKLSLMDNGNAERRFCFISDTVEMLMNILINSKSTVYNVSGSQRITIAELAKKIARINSAIVKRPKILFKISGTPNSSILSNRKYIDEFGKKKFIEMEKGLKITSDWFRNLRNYEGK